MTGESSCLECGHPRHEHHPTGCRHGDYLGACGCADFVTDEGPPIHGLPSRFVDIEGLPPDDEELAIFGRPLEMGLERVVLHGAGDGLRPGDELDTIELMGASELGGRLSIEPIGPPTQHWWGWSLRGRRGDNGAEISIELAPVRWKHELERYRRILVNLWPVLAALAFGAIVVYFEACR